MEQSRLTQRLVEWRLADGYNPAKGGRKATVTDARVLTLLMMLLALEAQPLHVTLMALMVKHHLTTKAAVELGLNPDDGTEQD